MLEDPVCPTDGVVLWWKGVAHWIDPNDGTSRLGAWQCHKCRVRFVLNSGELVEVERTVGWKQGVPPGTLR
jgi:hypothetical protein